MTKQDNPEYYERCKLIVNSIFLAEHAADQKHNLSQKLRERLITPEQYLEAIVDEWISTTDKDEVMM